jgi:hypothetical protein
MPAEELLCYSVGIDPCRFSKEENIIVEVELFARVCEELKKIFKDKLNEYSQFIKLNTHLEEEMLDAKLIYCVINDILITQEYSVLGIAHYTRMPEDVIYDVALGQNTNPSLTLSRKIIELHRRVRPDLYAKVIKRIAEGYEKSANLPA